MSILNDLSKEDVWQKFYQRKKEKAHLTKRDEKEWQDFINSKAYLPLAKRISQEGFYFSRPERKLVNKSGTDKKRVVYCFKPDETKVLKLLAYLLHKYDDAFAPNCFSFRKEFSVRRAIGGLIKQTGKQKYYCYKLDINNYFNSVGIDLLLPKLKELFSDDTALYSFFEKMLIWEDGTGNHGVMAGTPTSSFLSNVYLSDLDKHFLNLGVPYVRYSDDIIVFAATLEKLTEYKNYIGSFIENMNLTVNAKKEQIISAGEPWSFLGIEYNNGEIDLSPITLDKIKAKIRRKARALYRWKNRNNVPNDKALKVMIRVYNKKFFEDAGTNELTWSRWFFPLLTTDKGLHEVDAHLQMWLRFLVTGKHNAVNFQKVSYEQLKDLGYKSLVNQFHKGAKPAAS